MVKLQRRAGQRTETLVASSEGKEEDRVREGHRVTTGEMSFPSTQWQVHKCSVLLTHI